MLCISWLRDSNFSVKLRILLVSSIFTFMLLHERSFFDYSQVSDAPFLQVTRNLSGISPATSVPTPDTCDLLIGDWLGYEAEPSYNKSCGFISDQQNCMKNGRPDSDYIHWRWRPRGCEIPRFDPLKFLELMRDKRWAFVGDSISRNHIQSLLCMLSTVEEPTQVYHDEGYRNEKWQFPHYNTTASLIWSPFLAKSIIPQNINDPSTSEIDVHLDILDPSWTEHYKNWDYVIFSTGIWYSRSAIYYENDTVIGCHYCPSRNFTELGFDCAYRRVLKSVFDYIVASNHGGSIFYRTTSPDHFEGADWSSGGVCNKTKPAKEGEVVLSWLDKILRDIELEEFAKAYVGASEKGVKLRLFDVNPMSLLRPDGHPGAYRLYQPFSRDNNAKVIRDCLHWCLPGPIDSWNDVLMEMIVND